MPAEGSKKTRTHQHPATAACNTAIDSWRPAAAGITVVITPLIQLLLSLTFWHAGRAMCGSNTIQPFFNITEQQY
jgi:hypothetical protein